MSSLVTIFGGSGFLGRYIARRLAKQGWRVRVACRRPNDAGFVRTYGVVGQVEPVFCNVRDDESVRAVTTGAEVVVNCVGTFDAGGKNSFDAIHREASGRIARIAAEQGVARMVQISAIGADPEGASGYAVSKAEGEAAVLEHMADAMILRPSVMFGPEDEFFNRFAGMANMAPVLPLVGANTKFQPVYVDDVAKAAEMGILGKTPGGVYELGGPDVQTFRALMTEMLGVIQRRKATINMPFWMAGIMAFFLDMGEKVTFGLFDNSMLTRDQVTQLKTDNVVSENAKGFAELGIEPVATETILASYLWPFRPSGQYAAIKDSAKNLKI